MIVTFLGTLLALACVGFILALQARAKDQRERIQVTMTGIFTMLAMFALFLPAALRIHQLEVMLLEKDFPAAGKLE